jgi:hypothetical protein
VLKDCIVCGKRFRVWSKEKHKQKCCSHQCFGKINHGAHNGMWKGNDAGYFALHRRIESLYGKPKKCSFCGTTIAKIYEWANISGKYKQNMNDYVRLCRSCHRKLDKKYDNLIWMKKIKQTDGDGG